MTVTAVATPAEGGSVDGARLDAAVAKVFADPGHGTHALLVYRRGELLRETYGNGGGPEFVAESWSLGKTLVGLLAGRLVTMGRLDLDEPVALTRWPVGDPRRSITVRHLLTMSGSLAFSVEAAFWPIFQQSDHGLIYTGLPDVVAFAADRPLAGPPGSIATYNNADPTVLLAYLAQKLGVDGDGVAAALRREVLVPLGADGIRWSTDRRGMPVATGYVYGRARDWGAIGVMLARGGRVGDTAYMSPAFVRFMGTPAPGYPDAAYGGAVWLNTHGYYDVPRDALVMSGAGDQVVVVLPTSEVVIVRMGHLAKSRAAFATFNAALREIVTAVAR
jgi:CubicO group peptidase (beta-lactamase class C family)